jgi:hypothetical protein
VAWTAFMVYASCVLLANLRRSVRGRLEHENFIGILKDRIFVGNFSFVPFGT